MAESLQREERETQFLPESLKAVLSKLPTPEALQIVDDLGRTAWVIDNNNNNNNKAAVLDELVLERVAKLPPGELQRILNLGSK